MLWLHKPSTKHLQISWPHDQIVVWICFWFSICQTQPKHQNQILRRNAVCRLFRAVCERSLVVGQVLNCTLRSCLTLCTHRSILLGSTWQQIKHVRSLINLVCSKESSFGTSLKRDKTSPVILDGRYLFGVRTRLSIENTILAMFNSCAIKFPNRRLIERTEWDFPPKCLVSIKFVSKLWLWVPNSIDLL